MEPIWIWRCRDVKPYSALFNVMWESNDIKVCLKIQLLMSYSLSKCQTSYPALHQSKNTLYSQKVGKMVHSAVDAVLKFAWHWKKNTFLYLRYHKQVA